MGRDIRETIAVETVLEVLIVAERYVRWKATECGTLQTMQDHKRVLSMIHALEQLEPTEEPSNGLKPCPFCGGRPQLAVNCSGNPDDSNEGGAYIECMACHASTPLVFGIKESPITRLREIWNKRTNEESPV